MSELDGASSGRVGCESCLQRDSLMPVRTELQWIYVVLREYFWKLPSVLLRGSTRLSQLSASMGTNNYKLQKNSSAYYTHIPTIHRPQLLLSIVMAILKYMIVLLQDLLSQCVLVLTRIQN